MWSVTKSFAQQDAKWHVDSTQQENSCAPVQKPIKTCLSVTKSAVLEGV